ncbi:MAG: hypothetical protein ACP5PX_02290 [Candidatus Hadarchaeum sp.]|uniref:hypothetical protein n=1 Tax=Candidatus Hadarchaeum sp. TaxID=2883567 RepID=UPI003D12E962
MNMENDLRISQLEEKLNFLRAKISELERRITILERNLTPPKPLAPKTPHSTTDSAQKKTDLDHKYLSRAIDLAKRDYDRKYK